MFWKRALGLLSFFLGLAVLLQALSWLTLPKDNTAEAGMEHPRANGILGERPDSIDLLILGDSEAYTAISPLLLWEQRGYTSYVCATSSQRLSYTKVMLERAFRSQKPRLVLLETLPIYRRVSLQDVLFNELSQFFPVFRYHDRWKRLTLQDLTGPVRAQATDPNKGYVPIQKIVPYQPGDYMAPGSEPAPPAAVNKLYIRLIRDLCREHGAQLLLVSTPSPFNWSYARHEGVQALAQELDCPYLDLNLTLPMDWSTDTYDKGDHLNCRGAEKVTRCLGDYLAEQGLLPDRRQDPAFQSWHQALRQYKAGQAICPPDAEPQK